MSLRTPRNRAFALACVGLATLGALTAGGALPAGATPHGVALHEPKVRVDQNGCLVMENLTETVVDMNYQDVPPAGPSVGDVGVFKDHLTDSRGRLIATEEGVGYDAEVRASDGHLLGWYSETITLKGGTLRTFGQVDINAMLSGSTASIHVVGVGGRYFAMTGIREWDVLSQQLATSKITLCP